MSTIDGLLRFADDYSNLGWAVRNQMAEVLLDGHDARDKNHAAMALARRLVDSALAAGLFDEAEAEEAIDALTPASVPVREG